MWLFRHPATPYWQAGWRCIRTGKSVSRSTRTADKKLAKQRGIRLEREYDAADRAPTQTLHEALKALLEHKRRKKCSAATIEITECKAGHLLRLLGKPTPIDTLTLVQTERYLDVRRTEGSHDHTIHKELSNLLQALRVAKRHGFYPGEPKALWPSELDGAYTPQDTYLTVEQFNDAMGGMIESRRDHFAIYAHVGLRFSELYRLEAGHLNRFGRRLWVEGTKTKAARRWVDLDAAAYAVLYRRAEEHPEGLLFPDRWSRSRMVNDLKRVAKRTDTPAVSANDLRRTFSTWCADAGIDERTCLKWMGHTSSDMCRRVYQQLSARRGRAQIDLLSKYSGEITPSQGPSEQGATPRHERSGGADHAAKIA